MKPVTHYHVLFSGFTQQWSDPSNGFGVVRRALREAHPESETIWLPWHSDSHDLAMMVVKDAEALYPSRPKITVAGYSFGGTTAINFCRTLYSNGALKVDALCLADAVKRRSVYPHGYLAALNPRAKIRVPPNVLRVVAFYQRDDWPAGHRVRTESHHTEAEYIRLPGPHTVMDSHEMVRNTIMAQAESVYDVAV